MSVRRRDIVSDASNNKLAFHLPALQAESGIVSTLVVEGHAQPLHHGDFCEEEG